MKVLGTRFLGLTTIGAAILLQQAQRPGTHENPSADTFQASKVAVAALPKIEVKPKVVPVTLTEEGRKWLEKQEEIYEKTIKGEDGGLIDASTFVTPEFLEKMDTLAGRKFGSVEIVKLNPPENGYHYAFDVTEEDGKIQRWYMSQEPWYKDQYPNGRPLEWVGTAIWKKDGDKADKLTQNFFEFCEMFNDQNSKSNSLNEDFLLSKFKEAKENRECEIKDPAEIRKFDLPKDRPIGYIGLVDSNPDGDPVTAPMYDNAKYFPQLLSLEGYHMVSSSGNAFVIEVDSEPKRILEDQIRYLASRGVKDFMLNIPTHGSATGATFITDQANFTLKPDDLIHIFNTFIDFNFTLNVVPCEGAGFALALIDYKDPSSKKGRVTICAQTKIGGINQEGRLKGASGENDAPEVCAPYYEIFLYHHLASGLPYGKAHYKADKESKKLVPNDPEVISNSPKGGIKTSIRSGKINYVKNLS